MRDITLHDGTRIPKGTRVSANAHAHHHDPAFLAHADKFDAFRYARMRSVDVAKSYAGYGCARNARRSERNVSGKVAPTWATSSPTLASRRRWTWRSRQTWLGFLASATLKSP